MDKRIPYGSLYSEPRPDRWCVSGYINDQLHDRRYRLCVYSSSYGKYIARRNRRYTERVRGSDKHTNELECGRQLVERDTTGRYDRCYHGRVWRRSSRHNDNNLFIRYRLYSDGDRYGERYTYYHGWQHEHLRGHYHHIHRLTNGWYVDQRYNNSSDNRRWYRSCNRRCTGGYHNDHLYIIKRLSQHDSIDSYAASISDHGYDEHLRGSDYDPEQCYYGWYMEQQQPCGWHCINRRSSDRPDCRYHDDHVFGIGLFTHYSSIGERLAYKHHTGRRTGM